MGCISSKTRKQIVEKTNDKKALVTTPAVLYSAENDILPEKNSEQHDTALNTSPSQIEESLSSISMNNSKSTEDMIKQDISNSTDKTQESSREKCDNSDIEMNNQDKDINKTMNEAINIQKSDSNDENSPPKAELNNFSTIVSSDSISTTDSSIHFHENESNHVVETENTTPHDFLHVDLGSTMIFPSNPIQLTPFINNTIQSKRIFEIANDAMQAHTDEHANNNNSDRKSIDTNSHLTIEGMTFEESAVKTVQDNVAEALIVTTNVNIKDTSTSSTIIQKTVSSRKESSRDLSNIIAKADIDYSTNYVHPPGYVENNDNFFNMHNEEEEKEDNLQVVEQQETENIEPANILESNVTNNTIIQNETYG